MRGKNSTSNAILQLCYYFIIRVCFKCVPKLSFLVYELLKVKDYILLIIYPWALEQRVSCSSYLVEKKGKTEKGKEEKIKEKRSMEEQRGEKGRKEEKRRKGKME